MVCQTRPYETWRFTVGLLVGIYRWAGRVFEVMRVRPRWFVKPAPTRHRDLPLGCWLEFTVGRGGFSRLCVLDLDGLSNPPLRDIAIYRWVVDWNLPPKRGGFSGLCVLGKDGLSNPPLRDIAKLWNIRRQPFGAQLFNS